MFDPAGAAGTGEAEILAAFQSDLMEGFYRDLMAEYGDVNYNQALVRQLVGLAATP
jgi:hypothetical protein